MGLEAQNEVICSQTEKVEEMQKGIDLLILFAGLIAMDSHSYHICYIYLKYFCVKLSSYFFINFPYFQLADVDDFLLFFYLFNNIHLMVLDDVGPYLSLKIEDFSTTPSQELKRYWSDKSFGELTEKFNEHKSNQLFREIIEKKKLSFDELLSACEDLVKIARSKTEENRLKYTTS